MVRPARFAANPQTMSSNAFQRAAGADVARAARAEFDALLEALRGARIDVQAFDDTDEPAKPDAVFPNNWFSTHGDGTVVLYPMCAHNRRAERRLDLLDALRRAGFEFNRLVDLSAHEIDDRFLEGTGSLVLDRASRVAYACLSPRTDAGLLAQWGAELGYRTFAFHAEDREGRPIYHTNVMLAIGTGWALVCLAAVPDPAERASLAERLTSGGREVVEIDLAQLEAFAGNLLELESPDGPVIALSATAHAALRADQRATLAAHARLLVVAVPTIEAAGGGSVRCMLAEIFLPHCNGGAA